MRKVIFAVMMMFAASAYGFELPDSVGEWRCVKEEVVPLVADANGSMLGRMVYRDYERESPFGIVNIILTEGSGTGSLYVPEMVNDSEGVMPSDSGYRLITIAGRKSIMEVHSQMPAVLAVNMSDNIVLTIESQSLGESGMISFAEEILSSWKDTE